MSLGDTDGWTAEPVDHDPFAANPNRDFGYSGNPANSATAGFPGRISPEAVIPEPDASIRAQHQALLDPNDPREAMLYNPGQQPIESPHLGQTRLQDGRVVQFDRHGLGALTPQKISSYDRSNRLNELLQYGPVSKDDAVARTMAGEQPAVVTTTRNGVPVKEAAGAASTVPAQVAAQHATRGPFDRVEVNHPASVLGRLGFQGGGGLESEEEELQQGREIGTASGSDLGPASPVRSPGLFGGARPVQPSAQFGASAVTEPEIAPAPAPTPIARDLNPLGFYSHGADVAANLPQKVGTTQQMRSALEKQGVKPIELEGVGLGAEEMPYGWKNPPVDPPISRDELANRFQEASPPLQETVLGSANKYPYRDAPEWEAAIDRAERAGDHDEAARISAAWEGYGEVRPGGGSKFDQYTLPGGQNYREVLMHVPTNDKPIRSDAEATDIARTRLQKMGMDFDAMPPEEQQKYVDYWRGVGSTGTTNDFTSSHWDQRPNIVAHLRLNDRTGENGENLLHMEELQSDWGQQGRDKGFQDPEKLNAFHSYMADARGRMAEGIRQDGLSDGLPDEQATRIANNFVTKAEPHHVATYLNERDKMEQAFAASRAEQNKLQPGPYVTNTNSWADLGLKRALIEAARNENYTHLSWTPGEGQNAIYEGQLNAEQQQGMRGFYDPIVRDANGAPMVNKDGSPKVGIVPTQLGKLAKKLDPNAKIGTSQISDPTHLDRNFRETSKTVPSLEITPLMRQRILQGLPQYRRGGRVGFQDGGGVPEGLEPVSGNPFDLQPPDRTMHQSDLNRAKGFPEPRSPMHDRIAAASRDEPRHGFQSGGGLENEEEELQRGREIGTASGSDLGPASPVRSPGLFGGARPVQPSAQFGASPVTEPAFAPQAPAAPSIVRSDDGVLRHADPAFPEGRIATRVPTAVGPRADNAHLSNDAKIGLDTIQSQPAMYAKTAQIGREMPYEPGPVVDDKPTWLPTNLHNFPADATDEEIHQGLVNHFKSNILALHDAVPDEIRPGSQLWYDGANSRATQKAQTYDRPVENTAGVYAALSPQMDWFKNVSLGDRLMDIMHTKGDTPFTPEMWKWARTYAKGDPDTLATYRMFNQTGRKLSEINDPENQALWVRAYDEAHNPRDYNIVNPDGTFGPVATNNDGSNSKVGWGSMKMIEKAISAFNAPDMPTISRAMGDRHKVRNFFNNIVAPNSDHGDVTIDTHAIAAANLRPMAGEDKDVDIGLGATPRNRATGAGGLYGAYLEAYRQAAAERGIQPRQMQSITWEAMRGLWNPSEKSDPAINAHVQNVWNQYQLGNIDQPTAQRMLMTHPETGASLVRPPEWWTAGWRPSGR